MVRFYACTEHTVHRLRFYVYRTGSNWFLTYLSDTDTLVRTYARDNFKRTLLAV